LLFGYVAPALFVTSDKVHLLPLSFFLLLIVNQSPGVVIRLWSVAPSIGEQFFATSLGVSARVRYLAIGDFDPTADRKSTFRSTRTKSDVPTFISA
jgi:hypothetical protein